MINHPACTLTHLLCLMLLQLATKNLDLPTMQLLLREEADVAAAGEFSSCFHVNVNMRSHYGCCTCQRQPVSVRLAGVPALARPWALGGITHSHIHTFVSPAGPSGRTALHIAVSRSSKEAAELLLSKGADINAT